jgi:hypothetical protein
MCDEHMPPDCGRFNRVIIAATTLEAMLMNSFCGFAKGDTAASVHLSHQVIVKNRPPAGVLRKRAGLFGKWMYSVSYVFILENHILDD